MLTEIDGKEGQNEAYLPCWKDVAPSAAIVGTFCENLVFVALAERIESFLFSCTI
jgi:hypothetical protein